MELSDRSTPPKRKRQITRRILCILAVVGVLYMGADFWLAHKIKRMVVRESATLSHGRYRASVRGVRINPFRGSLTLIGVSVVSDSIIEVVPRSSEPVLQLHIDRLRIQGIHRDHTSGSPALSVRSVQMIAPHLTMYRKVSEPTDTAQLHTLKVRSPFRVGIGVFTLTEGTVETISRRDTTFVEHAVSGIDFHMEDFSVDAMPSCSAPASLTADFNLDIRHIAYKVNGGALLFALDSLRIATGDNLLTIRGFRMSPRYAQGEFARKAPNHADWMQVNVGSVRCLGFDFGAALSHRYSIDTIFVSDVDVQSYKNRQIQQPERIKKLLSESIQRFPFPLDVRYIGFERIRAIYEELPPTGVSAGKIIFDSLSGHFDGLTNRPTSDRSFYTLVATGLLMGKGVMNARFQFPIEATNDHFDIRGSLGSLDMKTLNPILEPLVDTRIVSGQIRSMDFHIEGTTKQSAVSLVLRYDSLDIAIVRNEGDTLRPHPVLSLLIDDLVIHRNNPDDRGLRTGNGVADRNPYLSQFNYLWKSILPGIKNTLIGHDRHPHQHERRKKIGRHRLF